MCAIQNGEKKRVVCLFFVTFHCLYGFVKKRGDLWFNNKYWPTTPSLPSPCLVCVRVGVCAASACVRVRVRGCVRGWMGGYLLTHADTYADMR